jgi:hypothetical protein
MGSVQAAWSQQQQKQKQQWQKRPAHMMQQQMQSARHHWWHHKQTLQMLWQQCQGQLQQHHLTPSPSSPVQGIGEKEL